MFSSRTRRRWGFVAIIGLTICLGFSPVFAADERPDLKGTPNPEPGKIAGATGDPVIRVQARGDKEDYRNLQWAFDNAGAGGTVELAAGEFYLGDGKADPRETVLMRRGLRVVGKKEGDTWQTVVRGGGALIMPGVGPIESGPFRIVNESDSYPAVFEGIWFREWSCEVIFSVATQGLEVRNCRISHPYNTAEDGPTRYVHAIWSTGQKSTGDFIIENNLVELGNYSDGDPHDEQLMGLFFANHDTIRVTDNVIIGVDEGIEILGNRIGQDGKRPPADIIITGNRLEMTQNLTSPWPGTYALLITGNIDTRVVRIENNDITVRGKGWAMGLSGENFRVANNRIKFEKLDGKDPAGLLYVGFGKLFGQDMGASLNNSVWENNTIEGAVSDYGILFTGGSGSRKIPNESHGNRFDLGEGFAKLGASTMLSLGEGVHDNVFTGVKGKVNDDSPEGANKY